jgi:hypothetical protein
VCWTKENKCANFEQNPMVDKRVIQANELEFRVSAVLMAEDAIL